jgi:hypothetical protein
MYLQTLGDVFAMGLTLNLYCFLVTLLVFNQHVLVKLTYSCYIQKI